MTCFQFLLGCYFLYKHVSPKLLLFLSIPFRMLLISYPKTAWPVLAFQFLLGCYLQWRSQSSSTPVVLSIPFRMLRTVLLQPSAWMKNCLSIPFRMLRFCPFFVKKGGKCTFNSFQDATYLPIRYAHSNVYFQFLLGCYRTRRRS